MKTDLAVVVRAAGERTECACIDIAEAQSGVRPRVIRERPFWRALGASFEAGLDASAQWTLMLDADILLAPGAVSAALTLAERAEDQSFFALDLMVLDRGFGGPAHAGAHLYRTSLFERARRFVPETKDEIRPETFLRERMAACGFASHRSTLVFGVHDYEQYYRDLYRKQFVRAYKFRHFWNYMLDRCRRDYRDDDFKAMLWGFLDGLRASHDKNAAAPVLDALAYRAGSDEILALLDLPEKPPLPASAATRALPEETLRSFRPDELYHRTFSPPRCPLVTDTPEPAWTTSVFTS